MRVMVLARSSDDSECADDFTEEQAARMQEYMGELVKAGVLLDGGKLDEPCAGKRITFSGRDRTVIDGPFTEAKELVGGYWLWQVKSMDEAVEWLKRAPFTDTEMELRAVVEHPQGA